jgi:hypothetical protein
LEKVKDDEWNRPQPKVTLKVRDPQSGEFINHIEKPNTMFKLSKDEFDKIPFRPMPEPMTKEEEEKTDAILPLSLQFFDEMESQKKTAEYRNYEMDRVKRLWFMNMETKKITHCADIEPARRHNDTRPDRTLKQKYKYPITALYYL